VTFLRAFAHEKRCARFVTHEIPLRLHDQLSRAETPGMSPGFLSDVGRENPVPPELVNGSGPAEGFGLRNETRRAENHAHRRNPPPVKRTLWPAVPQSRLLSRGAERNRPGWAPPTGRPSAGRPGTPPHRTNAQPLDVGRPAHPAGPEHRGGGPQGFPRGPSSPGGPECEDLSSRAEPPARVTPPCGRPARSSAPFEMRPPPALAVGLLGAVLPGPLNAGCPDHGVSANHVGKFMKFPPHVEKCDTAPSHRGTNRRRRKNPAPLGGFPGRSCTGPEPETSPSSVGYRPLEHTAVAAAPLELFFLIPASGPACHGPGP